MNIRIRRLLASVPAGALVLGMCAGAIAQQWPTRPVRLVVPFAPGGNIDIAARLFGNRLQDILGQPFVVENRPGAGGMIAADAVAAAAPDGYTYFVGANGPLLFSPVINGRANFDWRQSFTAVSAISFTPLVLQVHPSVDVRTVRDLIDLAKKRDLFMASGGQGSTNHLVSELLQTMAGAKWTTVTYKGNAPALAALMAGEVQFSFEQVSVALPLLKDGKSRALAVTSKRRFAQLPEVPSFEELGYKDFEAVTWVGLFGPAKVPAPIVNRLNEVSRAVAQEPDILKKFTDLGSELRPLTSEAFTEYVNLENERWVPVIRRAGIKGN